MYHFVHFLEGKCCLLVLEDSDFGDQVPFEKEFLEFLFLGLFISWNLLLTLLSDPTLDSQAKVLISLQ